MLVIISTLSFWANNINKRTYTLADTSIVRQLIVLSDTCLTQNKYDSCFLYAQNAYIISKKIQYTVGEAKGMLMMGRSFARSFQGIKAIPYIKRAIEIAHVKNFTEIEIQSHLILASVYSRTTKIDSAYWCVVQIKNCDLKKIQKKEAIACYTQIFMYSGQYSKFFEKVKELIQISKELNDTTSYKNANLDCAAVYIFMQQFAKAKIILSNLLDLGKDERFNNFVKMNYSSCLMAEGKYQEAKSIILQVYNDSTTNEHIGIRAGSLTNLIDINLHLKDFYKCSYYLDQLKLLVKENNEEVDFHMYLLASLSQYYFFTNNKDSAEYFLEEFEKVALKKKSYWAISDVYETVMDYYKKNGNYKEAFRFIERYHSTKDTMLNEQNRLASSMFMIDYEFDKKNKEIELLNSKVKISKLQAKQKQAINLIIILGLILFTLILAFVLVVIHRKRKTEQKINEQKLELLEQQRETEKLKSSLEGQERERERIAKELHDGVGGNLAAIKLQLSNVQNIDHGRIKEIGQVVDYTYSEVRNLSHNLMPPEFKNTDLDEVVNRYISLQTKNRDITIEFINLINKEELKNQWSLEIDIFRMIQEGVTNIIKHSHATKAFIQLTRHEESINLIIEDNGIGFNVENNNSGIGLRNMKQRVALRHGTIEINSTPQKGCTINIGLPIAQHQLMN